MEGVLEDECYQQAKDKGCKVNTVSQDSKSTSAKVVYSIHPIANLYKCDGHVGRAHTNNLRESSKKEFTDDIKRMYKEKFPSIETVKCK